MAASPDERETTDVLEPEYDFRSLRGIVRGKYAERYRERLRVVRLAPDISAAFADEEAVNSALREYLSWQQGQSTRGAGLAKRWGALLRSVPPIRGPAGVFHGRGYAAAPSLDESGRVPQAGDWPFHIMAHFAVDSARDVLWCVVLDIF